MTEEATVRPSRLLILGSLLQMFCVVGAVVFPSSASADWMGEYYPLYFGSSWTYENVHLPGDTYTTTVFESIVYEGHPAVRIGSGSQNHWIASCDGQTMRLFALVDEGVLYDMEEDLIISEFADGDIARAGWHGAPYDSVLIRVWDNMDPDQRIIYGVDPPPGELVMHAWYDSEKLPNYHNQIVESNLPPDFVPPQGAVTDLEWFLRDVGTYGVWGIDAESGAMEDGYFLVDHLVSVDDVWIPEGTGVVGRSIPNPFEYQTRIRCFFAAAHTVGSSAAITIHDCSGRRIRSLRPYASNSDGWLDYIWDGRDDEGRKVSSGVYHYRLGAKAGTGSAKILLLR